MFDVTQESTRCTACNTAAFLLILATVVSSCTQESGSKPHGDAVPLEGSQGVAATGARRSLPGAEDAAEPLKASQAFVGTGNWGLIAEVVAVGDSLFVYDMYGPPAVTVLDRESGGVVGTFGRKGTGPAEFQDMSDVFRDHRVPGQFWAYDVAARRLSLYGPGDSGWIRLVRTVPVDVRGYAPYLRIHGDGLVMGGIFDGGSPVRITDSTGRRVRERYGRYPAHEPGDSLRTHLNANRPQVAFHPTDRKVALAYMHFNVVQFYDLESGRVLSVAGPDPFEPQAEDLLDLNPRKFAYAKVRSTERYVYAMFCGCTNADRRSRLLHLQVFTWEGELVSTIPIDRRSWQWVFDVAPDDRFIYTMTDDPFPQVLVTALPPNLQHTGAGQ